MEQRKCHCLQHAIAAHLLDADTDPALVQACFGHAHLKHTTIDARCTAATREAQARPIFASYQVVSCVTTRSTQH